MSARGRVALGAVAVLVGLVPALRADEARFVNARLTSHSAAAGLSGTFEALQGTIATEPAWIGYAVPGTSRGDGCCERCLERDGSGSRCSNGKEASPETASKGVVRLEAPEEIAVLFRVEAGAVGRIRTFPSRCAKDAAGRRIEWLTDVKPAESTALLASFVARGTGGELFESALAAIAFHADTSADALLDRFAAAGQALHLRKQATFWMGVARGRPGYLTLARLVREDAAPELREHVVFALTQSHEPAAVEAIIEVARHDSSPQVRGQALFWLGQKASRRSADILVSAVENDPEAEVKEKAVFALSQLPRDEGVPLLVHQARTNKDPRVRQKAMFWLGQSGDPRALRLFEEILAR